jgi:hypothetical protein
VVVTHINRHEQFQALKDVKSFKFISCFVYYLLITKGTGAHELLLNQAVVLTYCGNSITSAVECRVRKKLAPVPGTNL